MTQQICIMNAIDGSTYFHFCIFVQNFCKQSQRNQPGGVWRFSQQHPQQSRPSRLVAFILCIAIVSRQPISSFDRWQIIKTQLNNVRAYSGSFFPTAISIILSGNQLIIESKKIYTDATIIRSIPLSSFWETDIYSRHE